MKTLLAAVSVFFLLLLTHTMAWAQATAQLSGTVRDESGAVLPGVTVTVTQTDTGFTRTVVTDGSGAYVMPNLPIGPYRLEVSLQGFRTYVQTGIVLQVGATPTINAVLAVGNLEETVSVEAAAPLVDVQSAGISEVVEQRAHRGAAAAGAPGHRSDRARRRRRQHRRRQRPAESSGLRRDLGRRRPAHRRRLRARRRDAQRPLRQHEHAVPVP